MKHEATETVQVTGLGWLADKLLGVLALDQMDGKISPRDVCVYEIYIFYQCKAHNLQIIKYVEYFSWFCQIVYQ